MEEKHQKAGNPTQRVRIQTPFGAQFEHGILAVGLVGIKIEQPGGDILRDVLVEIERGPRDAGSDFFCL